MKFSGLKKFNHLFEMAMISAKGKDVKVNDMVKILRQKLVEDPKTIYFGRILQGLRLVIIPDLEVNYSDPNPDAYRDPLWKQIYCPEGFVPTPKGLEDWMHMPTLAVDAGGNIYVGEQFIEKKVREEFPGSNFITAVKSVLLHETMHISELTFMRRGNRDMKIWNIATDAFINYNLIKNGFILPQGCILPDKDGNLDIDISNNKKFRIVIAQKTAEMIYDELSSVMKGEDGEGQGGKKVFEKGDPVFNKATGEYGVILEVGPPHKVRIITKEEAMQRGTK